LFYSQHERGVSPTYSRGETDRPTDRPTDPEEEEVLRTRGGRPCAEDDDELLAALDAR